MLHYFSGCNKNKTSPEKFLPIPSPISSPNSSPVPPPATSPKPLPTRSPIPRPAPYPAPPPATKSGNNCKKLKLYIIYYKIICCRMKYRDDLLSSVE